MAGTVVRESSSRTVTPVATLLPVSLMALAAAGVFWLVHASIIDDSYITLGYARNLGLHAHWGLIADRTSNTATSPLNVLLLGGLTAVLRHPVWALAVVFVVANAVLGWALLRTARALSLPPWGAVTAWLLVLANPLVLSATGLEVTLGAAVVGLALMAAAEARGWVFGLCGGLAVLTRIDLAIVVLVLFAGTRSLWRHWWRIVLAGGAVAVPWFVFSWVRLGSFVPDTLLIKTHQGGWGQYRFGTGPRLYLQFFPAATVLTLLPAILGVGCLAGLIFRRGPAVLAALGVAGVVHYLAYTALGVPPYHWYYAPSLVCLSICFALGVKVAFARQQVFGAVAGLVAVAQAGFALSHGIPWRLAAVTTNWATPAQYTAIGRALPALVGNRPVQVEGEIGTVAYFCDCTVLDPFSDRGRLVTAIDTTIAQVGPLERGLLRLNYHFLDRATPPLGAAYILRDVSTPPPGVPAWPVSSPWHGPLAPPDGYYVLIPS